MPPFQISPLTLTEKIVLAASFLVAVGAPIVIYLIDCGKL